MGGWKVVRLNEAGMDAFRKHLQDLREGKVDTWPSHLVDGKGKNKKFIEPMPKEVELRLPLKPMNKMDLASRIVEDFKPHYPDIRETFSDRGLWSALSCVLPQIWKPGTKPKADEKYIPGREYNNFYRHNLMSICWIKVNHDQHGYTLLEGDVHKFTEMQEQIAAAPIMNQSSIWEMIDKIYMPDGTIHPLTRGKGPASIRSLKKYIRKLAMTWDIKSLDSDELIQLLDGRFAPLFEK